MRQVQIPQSGTIRFNAIILGGLTVEVEARYNRGCAATWEQPADEGDLDINAIYWARRPRKDRRPSKAKRREITPAMFDRITRADYDYIGERANEAWADYCDRD